MKIVLSALALATLIAAAPALARDGNGHGHGRPHNQDNCRAAVGAKGLVCPAQ